MDFRHWFGNDELGSLSNEAFGYGVWGGVFQTTRMDDIAKEGIPDTRRWHLL